MNTERRLVRLSEVQGKQQNWVWTGRIPTGAITDLSGDPGQAKSRIVYDLAARITRGKPMPGETVGKPPGGVVLLQGEDDVASAVQPLMQALGADMGKVFAYDPTIFAGKPLSLPDDLELVEEAVIAVNAKLVVIDPATAIFECNPNDDRSVREALQPLAELAAKLDFGVIIVRHLRKSGGANMLYRGAGSIAWVAAARSGLTATADPRTADLYQHLLVQTKTNLTGAKTIAYKSVLLGNLVGVEWLGEVPITARELGGGENLEHSKLREATEVLYLTLAEKPRPCKEVQEKAKESGVASRTLDRAKAALGIVSEKQQFSPSCWHWTWRLPDHDTPLLAQLKAKYPPPEEDTESETLSVTVPAA